MRKYIFAILFLSSFFFQAQTTIKMEKEGASFEELEHLTLGSLRKAVIDGDVVNGSLMAGQSAGLVKKEQTCQEIIEEVVTDARALLAGRK